MLTKIQSTVEKFKVLPRIHKGDEERKGEDQVKKVTMGKGYFSLESADVAGDQKVYVIVFRSLIGKTLYQGTLSALHSKKRRIEDKPMKL